MSSIPNTLKAASPPGQHAKTRRLEALQLQALVPQHPLANHHAKCVGTEINGGKQLSAAFHAKCPCLADSGGAATAHP